MLLGETRTAKMLNLVWLNLASRINLIFLLRGKGLNCALLCSSQRECRHKASIAKQKSSLFLFFGRRKGFLLTKRPFRPQTPTNPTARERLLHCVQV